MILSSDGLLHDIGNQVRPDHNLHSEILAIPILDEVLTSIYPDENKKGYDSGLHIALHPYSYGIHTKLYPRGQPAECG